MNERAAAWGVPLYAILVVLAGCTTSSGNVLLTEAECPQDMSGWLRPGDSIQTAIDEATDGDTICLGPGRYIERLVIPDTPLAIVGVHGWQRTIVDAQQQGNVVTLLAGDTNVRLEGLTITGGLLDEPNGDLPLGGGVVTTGAGLYADDRSFELTNVRVTANRAVGTSVWGAGVAAFVPTDGRTTVLTNVRVDHNVAVAENADSLVSGVGASFVNDAGLTIRNSLFLRNTTEGGFDMAEGGGLLVTADALLEDVTILENVVAAVSLARGAGLATILDISTLMNRVVRRAYIGRNRAEAESAVGGGIHGRVRLEDTVVTGNEAIGTSTARGGGVYVAPFAAGGVQAAAASALRTIFAGNVVEGDEAQGGAWWIGDRTATLGNVVFAGNMVRGTVTEGGAALFSEGATLTLSQVTFTRNESTQSTAGSLWLGRTDNAQVVTNAVVSNNSAGGIVVTGSGMDPSFSFSHVANAPAFDITGHPAIAGAQGNSATAAVFREIGGDDPAKWDLRLAGSSELVDAGDDAALDPDGTRSDPGAFGGLESSDWTLIEDDVFLGSRIF